MSSKTEQREAFKAAKRMIDAARRILVSGHLSPDGDSLGSMIAMVRLLRAAGKDAYAAADVNALGKLDFLEGVEDIIPVRKLRRQRRFDLLVAVDNSGFDRMPPEIKVVAEKLPRICIDHHVTNDGSFAEVSVVDGGASSTGEIVWRFAKWNEWKLDHATAEALWVAMITDSGRFAYDSTTPGTLRAAGDLLKHGVRTALINDIIYGTFPRKAIELKRIAWRSLHVWKNRRVAEVSLSRDDFRAVRGTKADAEDIIEIPRSVAQNEIALFFYQIPDRTKETRCSIRTRGDWDATALAARFGGGGHVKAAGCTIKASMGTAKRQMRAAVKEMLKNASRIRVKTFACTMLLALAGVMSALGADGLAEQFRSPSDAARPQVWWHWMNGNVTKEGITADLEAMKSIGIGGAHIFDVDIGIPRGTVDFNTSAWSDNVRWAAHEAKRLGLEIGLSNCSGFSSSGGPWVTPEYSMKRLVWTELSVRGGAAGCGQPALSVFAETNGFYRDVAVVAFHAPKDVHLADVSGAVVRKEPLRVTVSFDEPFRATMLGLRIETQGGWSDDCLVRVETSGDGKGYSTILERRIFTRLSGKSDLSMRNIVLPDMMARHYRVTVMPRHGLICKLHDFDLGRWGGLENLPLKTFSLKAESIALSDISERGRAEEGETVADVQDLSDKLRSDGTLDWTVPDGEWRILRFGCAATGVKVRPASPCGSGLETDKLNAESTRRHFNAYIGPLLEALGPEKDAIDTVLVDSYEVGAQNWTQGLERMFYKRFGYEMIPYMPVFAGYVVGDVETSERFLADFRRLVADMFAENYGDEMARLCHTHGLKFSLEPHGDFASDDMRYGQDADIVIGNFWSGPKGTVNPGVERMVASIAHVWGRRYVGSEAFTAQPKGWLRTPAFIKAQGDYAYTLGINRIIYHRYAHQPWVNPSCAPGMTMGPWGMHFERTQTWWTLAKDWISYQTRCQQMLQEGRFVADVALFCGEESPNSLKDVDRMPCGYGFDGCAAAAVLAMRVENGDLVLPSGMRYRMLALPVSNRMSLAMLGKIGSLVANGATVVGRKPEKSIGLADGEDADRCVKSRAEEIWRRGVLDTSVAEALRVKGLQPDFTCLQSGITYIHRQYDDGEDAYFVAWQGATGATVRCSFRQRDRVPELWNPETGEMADAPEWRMHDGRTDVTVDFEPSGSVFVVFRRHAKGVACVSRRVRQKVLQEHSVTGGWDVAFPPDWGAPERLHLDSLRSWTGVPDDGVRFFSGTATYSKRISLDRPLGEGERLVLDLGEVREFAEVAVNGIRYPVLWKPPFRVDVTEAARRSRDLDLEIRVTNLWVNRLIGDEFLPPDREWKPGGKCLKEIPDWVKHGERSPTGRHTFTTWHHWTKDDKPIPSGLLGPVVVRVVKDYPQS